MLRSDLLLTTDELTGEHVLIDPITLSEFTLTDRQRALVEPASLPERTSGGVADFFQGLSDLCLLEPSPPPDQIVDRQRDQRRLLVTAVQRAKFEALLASLKSGVPFYRDWLSSADPRWTFDDLARMPILTKTDLRAAAADPSALVPTHRVFQGQPVLELTSGTTAERFRIAAEPEYRERMMDVLAGRNRHVRDVFKRRPDLRVCSIGSPLFDDHDAPLGEPGRTRPREQRMRGKGNLRFDSPGNIFTLPGEKLDQMLEEASDFRPGVLFGDPVCLSVFAAHVRDRRTQLPPIEFVMTAFAMCSEVSRRVIHEVFGCPVYDLYSATEFACLALQCERGQYHVHDEAFVVEITANGRPVAPGGLGRIVVTTLEKCCTPLLRYDTGDLARTSPVPCSCPFSHCVSLSSIEGRVQDTILDVAGATVTSRAVDHAIGGTRGFLFYGLLQISDTQYVLEIIPDATFSQSTLQLLDEQLHQLLGKSAALELRTVSLLKPAPSGKFRLAQRVSKPHENVHRI